MCMSSLSTGYSVDAFNAFGADEPRSQTLECVALDAAAADFTWTTHDCDEQAVYRKHGYLIMTGACVRASLFLPPLLHAAFSCRHLRVNMLYILHEHVLIRSALHACFIRIIRHTMLTYVQSKFRYMYVNSYTLAHNISAHNIRAHNT